MSRFNKKGPTEVILYVDGHTVSLQKTLSPAKYVMDDGEPFKGFGDDVPEPILKLLNLSEVTIQQQLNPNFLVTSTAGEVAKTLNRITRVEHVDKWVSELVTAINRNKKELDMLVEQKAALESDVLAYSNLPDMVEDVEAAEALEKQISELDKSVIALTNHIETAVATKKLIQEKDKLLNLKSDLEAAEKLAEELTKIDAESALLEKATDLSKRKIQLEQKEQILRPFIEAADNYTSINNRIREINTLVSKAKLLEADIKAKNGSVDSLRSHLKQLFVELKVCPFCLTAITNNTVSRIMEATCV
jgi:DNA repair exonuclease SbcCD ATPase subunit